MGMMQANKADLVPTGISGAGMKNDFYIELNTKPTALDWARALVLLGSGVLFIILIVTEGLTNYINLRFAWLSYVAAGLFLLLGGWSLLMLVTGRVRWLQASENHTPITVGSVAVAAIPLLMWVLVPSRPLGAEAINGSISVNPVGGVNAAVSYRIPPLERNILDWLREFSTSDNPAEFDGLPVDIVAFVYREPNMGEDEFMAARFTMSCCVADAYAIGVPVRVENASDFRDGVWVRVQGTLEAGQFRGDTMPIIRPTSVEQVEEPRQPYLYS